MGRQSLRRLVVAAGALVATIAPAASAGAALILEQATAPRSVSLGVEPVIEYRLTIRAQGAEERFGLRLRPPALPDGATPSPLPPRPAGPPSDLTVPESSARTAQPRPSRRGAPRLRRTSLRSPPSTWRSPRTRGRRSSPATAAPRSRLGPAWTIGFASQHSPASATALVGPCRTPPRDSATNRRSKPSGAARC